MIKIDELNDAVTKKGRALKGLRAALDRLPNPLTADDQCKCVAEALMKLEMAEIILDRLGPTYLDEVKRCISVLRITLRLQLGAPEHLS